MRFFTFLFFAFFPIFSASAQETGKVNATLFDGVVVGGYVDHGGYLNFTGPNVNFTSGNSKLILGMMPSLRFKEDDATPKNALVTPSLGVGITYCYKYLAFQVPLYYNPKTAVKDGKWNVGIGIGLRLNALNKTKKS